MPFIERTLTNEEARAFCDSAELDTEGWGPDLFLELVVRGYDPLGPATTRAQRISDSVNRCQCHDCRLRRSARLATSYAARGSEYPPEENPFRFDTEFVSRLADGSDMGDQKIMLDSRVDVPRYSVQVIFKDRRAHEERSTNYMNLDSLSNIQMKEACGECGEQIEVGEMAAYHYFSLGTHREGQVLCHECFSNLYFTCENCNGVFKRAQYQDRGGVPELANGNCVCEACLDDSYAPCSECGEMFHNDDLSNIDDGDIYYCSRCEERLVVRCVRCNEVMESDSWWITQDGRVCEDCFDNSYSECNNCSENGRIELGRVEGDGDVFLCRHCIDSNRIIRSHSYKPAPKFKQMKWEKEEKESPGATLYFGPELEVENIKNTCEPNALCILSDEYWRSARCKGQFYYKSDGSLSYGVELVGHPFSWEWFLAHRKNFEEWLALIQSKGFRSYSTSTCGLHIHMNKTAFSGQRLYKFMKFFHENGSFIYRMSGRKNRDDMDQWAAIDEEGAAKKNLAYEAKNKYKNKMGRYWAVNLEPERTIEIRIFKGTLNPGSFMRAFEFLRSLYLFTANGVVTIGNTTLQKYLRFAGELDEHDFRNLHQKLSLNRRFLDADVADGEEE